MQTSQTMKLQNTLNLKWLWLSLLVIMLDQVSKHLAMAYLSYREPLNIIPFFNLNLVYNPGAAFSFLSSESGWQRWFFMGISVVVSLVVFFWILTLRTKENWVACSLSLILGGALGNLIDRVIYGYVIDFIDIFYKQWHWPTFNIADTAISVGAIMLILSVIFGNSSAE